jgi:hypothetical protein
MQLFTYEIKIYRQSNGLKLYFNVVPGCLGGPQMVIFLKNSNAFRTRDKVDVTELM